MTCIIGGSFRFRGETATRATAWQKPGSRERFPRPKDGEDANERYQQQPMQPGLEVFPRTMTPRMGLLLVHASAVAHSLVIRTSTRSAG